MSAKQNLRTFYTLILTQTFSIIGSRISALAVGIWVFAETGNATPFTLVAFFTVLPQVAASGLSGVLADRWDRRYVMVLSDAGQAIGTVLLLISFASGGFELWHLYTVAAIQAIFGVFQGPAFMASVSMLIPDDQRDRANSIQMMTGPAASIIAPLITGFLYAFIGVTGAIVIDLATFVIAVIVVLSVQIPRPKETRVGRAERGSVWHESLTGLRFMRQRKSLFLMVLYISFVNFLVGGIMSLTVPYILGRTGSETALGTIQSLASLGALLGAIIIGVWGGTRPRIHTIMPSIIVLGILMMLTGMSRSTVTLGASRFLLMLPLPFINTSFVSIMQAKTPPDIQGRVFAALGQMSLMLMPIAFLLVGPLADQVFEPAVSGERWETVAPLVGDGTGAGIGLMLVIAGGIVFLSSMGMYTRSDIRQLESSMPDYIPEAAPVGDEEQVDVPEMTEPALVV